MDEYSRAHAPLPCRRRGRQDFGKLIIAIANSFDEFLPGHVPEQGRPTDFRSHQGGRRHPREFNTMAVDDGIAMGHTACLFPAEPRLPPTVEYQVNAHRADARSHPEPHCRAGHARGPHSSNIPTVFVPAADGGCAHSYCLTP